MTIEELTRQDADASETSKDEASYFVGPSIGTGSGRPGIELTQAQLDALKLTLKLPMLTFESWVSVRPLDRNPGANPELLRIPATLRQRPVDHALEQVPRRGPLGMLKLAASKCLERARPLREGAQSAGAEAAHAEIGKGHHTTSIGVDQVIRVAIGVKTREEAANKVSNKQNGQISPRHVIIEGITGKRCAQWNLSDRERKRGLRTPGRGDRFANMLANKLAPTVHVVARVKPAEMTLTEQNAGLLPALAIDSLGLKSGDEIVLHAAELSTAKDGKNSVVHVKRRLKAYVATAEVIEQRRRTIEKGKQSQKPSNEQCNHRCNEHCDHQCNEHCNHEFNKHCNHQCKEQPTDMIPVMPEIWLDAAMRNQMGLPARGGAVIVAPSRRYMLADNLRELAIVAALALGGAAFSTEGFLRGTCVLLSIVVPVVLIALRVRSKLR